MGFVTLFKLLKALALFLREMWLRDRTFRQFVHENLPLIIVSIGFSIMTGMFAYLYTVARDQEEIIELHARRQTELQQEIDETVPYLTDQLAWYKERYYELKSRSKVQVVEQKEIEDDPSSPGPNTRPRVAQRALSKPGMSTKSYTQKQNPAASSLEERWKRLSE